MKRNLNLSRKLFLTAILPMSLVMLFGMFAIFQVHGTLDNLAVVSDTYDANTRAAIEMHVDFKEQVHQWKDVILRGNNPDDLEKHWAQFQRMEKKVDMDGAALVGRLGTSSSASLLRDFLERHAQAGVAYRKALDVFLASHYNARQADEIVKGIDHKLSEDLGIAIDIISEETGTFSRDTRAEAWRTVVLVFIGLVITLLVAIGSFFMSLRKHVLSPIGLLSGFAHRFGVGDHSERIDFKSGDEIGTLIDTFNRASQKIETLFDNLKTSNARYRNLIQGLDAIIWEFDPQTDKYTFVSQHAETMLGYPLSAWSDEPGFLKRYCHPDDLAASQEKIHETLAGDTTGEYTCRAIAEDGSLVWFNNRTNVIRDEHSKAITVLGVMVDITRMKEYEDRMAYLSTHDNLTGLPSRNLLVDRLARAIAHASGAANMTALMLINIDRFKSVNESLGHKLGDEVIKSIARRLEDLLGTDDTLAHLGADEFALVLRDIRKPEDAADKARKVLERVSLPLEIGGHPLVLNCSIGISIYPKDGGDSSAMLKNAGSALTRAKQQEKNSFKFYAEEMNARALFSLQLENKMRKAIQNREFVLYYQPQISLAENRVVGAEALIRWLPPGEPMVSPLDFIPLAEETSLILPIGEWVIQEACRQNKAWQARGFAPFCVAVNLSASQFSQLDIVAQVARALDETGLDPQYLELEITESAMMHDMELVIKNLEGLHGLGVKLAIDDFGTGYSSLSYLKRLPIDKLKVDKSFVQDIAVDSDDEAIVTAVIDMAHNLNMVVIAEGVETETQLQYLRERKCDEVQGYLFSKPLAAESFEKYLAGAGMSGRARISETV